MQISVLPIDRPFTALILNKLPLRSIFGMSRRHEHILIYSLSINARLSGHFFLKFSYSMNNKIVMEKKKKQTKTNTARKIGFTQIYTVQIWCKKVQTRRKSKATMVNTAFACQFTWGCKFDSQCGIYHLCPLFNLSLHFFAPNLVVSK